MEELLRWLAQRNGRLEFRSRSVTGGAVEMRVCLERGPRKYAKGVMLSQRALDQANSPILSMHLETVQRLLDEMIRKDEAQPAPGAGGAVVPPG